MTFDEMKKIADARTEGEWQCHNWDKMEGPHVVALGLWDKKSSCNGSFDVPQTYENAAFIAMAANNWDKLIAVVEAAKVCVHITERERWEALIQLKDALKALGE